MKKIILSLYLFLAFPAITTLLTGCYLYEGAATSYYQSTDYYEYDDLTYYHTHYVPTIGLYYWNDSPYWGYYDGWYYYYGYQHMYPWWYYYHYMPAYHYSITTHVHCHIGHRKYVTRPRGNRRMDNVKNRTYNVSVVNTSGINVQNNSNVPIKFQNKPKRNNNTNKIKYNINKQNYNRTFNNNQSNNTKPNKINIINRSNNSNNKVNINKTNTNRNNSNRSNKSNNRRPR
tara:strand:+ start:667 stop:1356 length:690 start_codon:yes stop_codon:yes gene_type:complete